MRRRIQNRWRVAVDLYQVPISVSITVPTAISTAGISIDAVIDTVVHADIDTVIRADIDVSRTAYRTPRVLNAMKLFRAFSFPSMGDSCMVRPIQLQTPHALEPK